MINLPPHLLQPLCIDTNITYDLDMSMFPGLDDPQEMYQPALLIATDWSDYVDHNTHCVTNDDHTNLVPNILDALDYLEDSNQSLFSDLDPSGALDSSTFRLVLEDVAEELSSSCDTILSKHTVVDTENGHGRQEFEHCDVDCCFNNGCGISADDLPAVRSYGRGQKRYRSADAGDADSKKKPKLMTDSSPYPSMVSVFSTYGQCDLSRLS